MDEVGDEVISFYFFVREKFRLDGNWIFMHYNQTQKASKIEEIEKKTGANFYTEFYDAKLKRTTSNLNMPSQTIEIYNQLCELANYNHAKT